MNNIHIELSAPSLVECYGKFMSLDHIKVTDLCHAAKVIIDIDLDSPFDGSHLKIGTEIKEN